MSQPRSAITRILFVCTGNICRSPLAGCIFEELARKAGVSDRFEVESAGLQTYHEGENIDVRMRRTAESRGFTINHTARAFRQEDLQHYDLILAMDRSHYRYLTMTGNSPSDKIKMFRDFDPQGDGRSDVPDPWYGNMEDFVHVFHIVERTCAELLNRLLHGEPDPPHTPSPPGTRPTP